MKPLSAWNYYKNNKKKVLPIMISIAIGIFLLYFMYIIGNSVISTAEAGALEALEHYTLFYSSEEKGIDEESLNNIRQNENVEKIIQVKTANTYITFMGGSTYVPILFAGDSNIDELFNNMNLKLKEGRMAKEDKEIVIHWRIAANKGLKVGDNIGSDVNDKEPLTGKYTVVGTFDGDSQLGFVPIENKASKESRVWLVMPKENKVKEMNSFIYKIFDEKMEIESLTEMEKLFSNNMSIVYVGSIFIELLIVLVLCITIGNTTYLHFYQRKKEFGILIAVGYKKREILKRIFYEILNITVAAYIAGVLLAILAGFILKVVYMDPKGSVMNLFNIKYLLFAAILPIFVLIFSLLPSARIVVNTDKIRVIEG